MSGPSTTSVTIDEVVEVTPELVAAFARLIPQLSSSPPPGLEELADIVGSPSSILLVARAPDGPIVGSLTLAVFRVPTGLRAWIEDVVVDETARGAGAGEALVLAALRRAEACGARSVDLTSRPSREAANRLYQRLGFAPRATTCTGWPLGTDPPPTGFGSDGARSAAAWLHDRPAEVMTGPGITLRRWSASDVDELVEAVNDTLDQLRPWMPWAQQPATPEGMGVVLGAADAAWEDRREFQFVIREAPATPALVGCCGLHNRVGVGALEIGYWVRTGYTGLGIATEAARLLTGTALALDGVERVEIRCDQANVRSAAIPPKLGFRLDRVEHRPPDAPGESDRHMVWVIGDSVVGDRGERSMA